MRLDLDPFDLTMLVMYAARQRAAREATTLTGARMAQERHSGFECHLIGAYGEWAGAKFLGIRMDRIIYPTRDNGYDLVYRGWTIDAKTFTYTGHNFEVFAPALIKADILLAAKLLGPASVDLVGWIPRDDFNRQARKKSYGYEDQFAVHESALDRSVKSFYSFQPRQQTKWRQPMYEPGKVADLPTTSPNKPLDQPRQDLWDAAQLIRKGGLCKGVEEDNEGRHCWVGAIKKVTIGRVGPPKDGWVSQSLNWKEDIRLNFGDRFGDAWDRWYEAHGAHPHNHEWIGWNNLPETTAEDVASKLEYAALS